MRLPVDFISRTIKVVHLWQLPGQGLGPNFSLKNPGGPKASQD